MFSISQASAITKLSERQIRQLCENQTIPATKIGRAWIITVNENELKGFVAGRRRRGDRGTSQPSTK